MESKEEIIESIINILAPDDFDLSCNQGHEHCLVKRKALSSLITLLEPFIPKWERIEDSVFEDCDTMLWIRIADDTPGEPAWIGSMCEDGFVQNYYTHVMRHPWCPSEPNPFEQLLRTLKNK